MLPAVGSGPTAYLDLCIAVLAAVFALAAWAAFWLTPQLSDQEPKPSFLSFCSAAWVWPKIRGPKDPPSTLSDLPDSIGTEDFNPDVFAERLKCQWSEKSRSPLSQAILRLMLPAWLAVHAVRGPGMMCALLDAYVISCIVSFVQSSAGVSIAVKIAALVMLKELGTDLLYCMSWFVLHNTGVIRVVIPLQVLILRKLRALSPESSTRTSAADVQQLMQDLRKLDDLLWSTPLNTICVDITRGLLSLWQLSALYGTASITTGIATGCVLFYLQTRCGLRVSEARDRERSANKTRLGNLKELTDSLEALKLYNWTQRYLAPLGRAAATMAAAGHDAGTWLSLSELLGTLIGDSFCIVAFFVATFVSGVKLDFEKFVLAEVYVQVLRESVKNMCESYSKTQELVKVTERLEEFLRLPERPAQEALEASSPCCSLSVSRGTFAWPVVENGGAMTLQPVLTDINLDVKKGELIVVSGPVGSGKSSLLLSLLGETLHTAGTFQPPSAVVAFQPQVPHLCDGTIRHNVLFGVEAAKADEERLQTALWASQIRRDMEDVKSTLHEYGELTQVGNRGSTISGGQRARTALARMVYAALSGAELVFMDDPFASIDNEMIASAWESAVLKTMSSATRIVVVNSQLFRRLGPDADQILLIDAGQIVYDGPPSGLTEETELLKHENFGSAYELCTGSGEEPGDRRRTCSEESLAVSVAPTLSPVGSFTSNCFCDHSPPLPPALLAEDCGPPELAEFLQGCPGAQHFLASGSNGNAARLELRDAEWAELRRLLQGVVSQHEAAKAFRKRPSHSSDYTVFATFCKRMLIWTGSAMLLSFLAEATTPYALIFLSNWGSGAYKLSEATCFGCFITLILGKSILNSIGGLLKHVGLARTSLVLRNSIDERLVSLSLPYFWSGGKISDVRSVVTTDLNDFEPLSSVPLGVAQNLFGLCAVIYTVPIALPLVLIAALVWRRVAFPKTWVFTHMIPLCNKHVYQRPLSIAAEEYDNRITIRAMKVQNHFDAALQRATMSLAYARFYLWGGLLLKDVLSLPIKAVFVVCAVGCVLHVQASGGDPAQALVLYNICWGFVRKINDLNWKLDKAVERLVQYRNIETFIHTEHVEGTAGVDPPSAWPAQGAISFTNVSFRYFPFGPLALRGVTVDIKPRERVGIVGPTGAGKSTFAKLLLRLGPLQGVRPSSEGIVCIDGVDIATLPLSILRRAIGVVPQEPTIFEDTLKHNLGGDGESDAEALSALVACGLEKLAEASLLHQPLSTDLSVGEKQLLAAARVLIRKPRVLVLDEATASLSQASADQLMEGVVRHCSEATILAISHRLRYILQCDRVVVMRRGGLLEAFDTPANLQSQSSGYFACQLRAEREGVF